MAASKDIKLKCGHTVNIKEFEPVVENGRWALEGYEPDCRRRVKVSLKHRQPTMRTMEKWIINGIAKAIDGCRVEPDGRCEHNAPSWLLTLGLI